MDERAQIKVEINMNALQLLLKCIDNCAREYNLMNDLNVVSSLFPIAILISTSLNQSVHQTILEGLTDNSTKKYRILSI